MAGAQACLIYVMLIIQTMGILSIVLIGVWLNQYGSDKGFGLKDSKKLINLHALLMSIGVFLLANGIVVYRAFRKFPARKVKWVHFILQLLGFVIITVGFAFTIVARDKQIQQIKSTVRQDDEGAQPTTTLATPSDVRKHFYSVHSWLGLMFFVIVCLQFLGGFFVFLLKMVEKSTRELFAAVHAFFGIFITILAGFVAVIGIEGKAVEEITDYEKVSDAGILANVASLAIIIMLAHVLYISVNPFFEWDVNDDTLEANPIE